MDGSLGICTEPRIKMILANWEDIKKVCVEATLVCGRPLPRYIKEICCSESCHIDNDGDADYRDIFLEAENAERGCLEAAFPAPSSLSRWLPSAATTTPT